MCLAVLALQTVPGLPLLIIANRDEFHARPTAAAAAWPDSPTLYAGRDLRAGGTWMGVTEHGRFAVITNVREPLNQRPDAPSRGALVETYLRSSLSPSAYLEQVHAMGDRYNGFNLIVGNSVSSWYYSNRSGSAHALAPGIYGVSNHLLDTPWPKLARTKAAFTRGLQDAAHPELETLYGILADKRPADDKELPKTGLSLARERLLSSPFIVSPDYGTRSSSVLALHADGQGRLHERRFGPEGVMTEETNLRFTWQTV